MIILPAIDLKDGKCVRLQKGDFGTVHQVASEPLAVAEDFKRAGAEWFHMVDLDGALDGRRKNAGIVAELCAKSGMKLELGGGIRGMAELKEAFDIGVQRAVIGSAAVGDIGFVREAAAKFGEKVAVGIDCREGRVMTDGWTRDSGYFYLDFAKSMEDAGVGTLIFTDIETDGMLTGPSFSLLERLCGAVGCDIIASGGVSCSEDLLRLRDMGLFGAIVGKAYYAGKIELAEAIRDSRRI